MASRKPTDKQVWEVFYNIVDSIRGAEYIRDGEPLPHCVVNIHKNKKTVDGSNGYFTPDPYPHLEIALKGREPDKSVQLIVHEFCHYWQWCEEFLDYQDDEGAEIYGKILDGHKVKPNEREKARQFVIMSEWDCEKRTQYLFKKWNLYSVVNKEEYIRSAVTYMTHIKWAIGSKDNPGSGVFLASYDELADALWGSKRFNNWPPLQSMLKPISSKHKKIFDEALANK